MNNPNKFNDIVGAMDRKSAAKYLSVSTRYLDDLLSAKKIKKRKLGRKTLILKVDLDSFLTSLDEGEYPNA